MVSSDGTDSIDVVNAKVGLGVIDTVGIPVGRVDAWPSAVTAASSA